MSESDQLKAKIQARLIESGEYDRISTELKQKLAESGWLDNVRRIANEEVARESNPNFAKLNQTLEPKALSMVPENIREETLKEIKRFLEEIVEKEG